MRRTWKRKLVVGGLIVVGTLGVLAGFAILSAWQSFGHRATGPRRQRMLQSPQWKDGHFENPEPLVNDLWASMTGFINRSEHVSPHDEVSVLNVDLALLATAPASGLRITWMGHSSVLIEIDGHRVLTDPIWAQRASPLPWVGPQRWYDPRIALAKLPKLDAVVISHDHYDHLDHATIVAMKDWSTKFVVPLGVAAHLEYWGVAPSKIVELDWWEHATIGTLQVHCTPARHASGRTLVSDKDATLWAGYALHTAAHRVYFSGDTGLFPGMRDIGARLGPFDLTLIETGQYHRAWPDWHIGPEQALLAHHLVQGRVFMPIHWALFPLAFHGWTEPAERVFAAGAKSRVQPRIIFPRPGQSVEPTAQGLDRKWWPSVPWETAAQHPIVSSRVEGLRAKTLGE